MFGFQFVLRRCDYIKSPSWVREPGNLTQVPNQSHPHDCVASGSLSYPRTSRLLDERASCMWREGSRLQPPAGVANAIMFRFSYDRELLARGDACAKNPQTVSESRLSYDCATRIVFDTTVRGTWVLHHIKSCIYDGLVWITEPQIVTVTHLYPRTADNSFFPLSYFTPKLHNKGF